MLLIMITMRVQGRVNFRLEGGEVVGEGIVVMERVVEADAVVEVEAAPAEAAAVSSRILLYPDRGRKRTNPVERIIIGDSRGGRNWRELVCLGDVLRAWYWLAIEATRRYIPGHPYYVPGEIDDNYVS